MGNKSPYKLTFSPNEYADMLKREQEIANKRKPIKHTDPTKWKKKQAQKNARKKQREFTY